MQIPRVTPVGLVDYPDDYTARPRRFRAAARVTAAAILLAFVLVGTFTTVISLGLV